MGIALFTDVYELTMAQSYLEHKKTGPAVFSLFARKLPRDRSFLVSCGLGTLVEHLQEFRFTAPDIDYLHSLNRFTDDFLEYLNQYRFRGNLYAIPEGRIVFQNEPLIQVEGSLPEVQILETLVINLIHFQTLIAAKAARTALVGRGKKLIDFGLRRAHSPEAGIYAARAAWVAGFDGTSDFEAGRRYGIPVFGTMAHSYVMAFASEEDAFRAYAKSFPHNALLLIDTYDTIACAHKVVALAQEGIKVVGVRLDSGNIPELATAVRAILDAGGQPHIPILVSGGVEETAIDSWLRAGVPIDSFGVGTNFITSADSPYLDMAYKLVEYEGQPKMKTSPGKATFPFKRQVVRCYADGLMEFDEVWRMGREGAGDKLVEPVLAAGELIRPLPDLQESRELLRQDLARLPQRLKNLQKESYEVILR